MGFIVQPRQYKLLKCHATLFWDSVSNRTPSLLNNIQTQKACIF